MKAHRCGRTVGAKKQRCLRQAHYRLQHGEGDPSYLCDEHLDDFFSTRRGTESWRATSMFHKQDQAPYYPWTIDPLL